jgi:hypothetical protein
MFKLLMIFVCALGVFNVHVGTADAGEVCEASGVSCSYRTCVPLDVMVNLQRMHIKCRLPEHGNQIQYFALPVSYDYAMKPSSPLRSYYTVASHNALWQAAPALAQAGLVSQRVLLISWVGQDLMNPGTAWGCQAHDCNILRGVVLTNQRF